MKTEELMIGDWVMNPFQVDTCESPYAKIDSIDGERVTFFLDGFVKITGSEKNLYPIPLTPEILEKNGFKSNYNEEFIIDDTYSIYMSILNPQYTATPRVMTGDIEDGDGGIYFNLSYVHELQHCLKILGIKKEIVLWKQ